MSHRLASGWQTVLADLSIILFMVTASALTGNSRVRAVAAAENSDIGATPVAVWRDDKGAPALRDWLASQGSDPRQQLSIVIEYPEGNAADAAKIAIELAAQSAQQSRIILEPGARQRAEVSLGFDRSAQLERTSK